MSVRKAPEQAAVEAYFARVSPALRPALVHLRKTIRAAAPAAEEFMSYHMPAFRQNGVLVYYAAFADHCSLFVASPGVRRKFSAALKPFQGGKGTVRFTPDHPLPAGLVTRIVQARISENEKRRSR